MEQRFQLFHQSRNSSRLMEFDTDSAFSRRLDVDQHAGAFADLLKIFQFESDPSPPCDGCQMDDQICGAAGTHKHGDAVFDSFPGDDVRRFDVAFDQFHDLASALFGEAHFFRGDGERGGASGEGETE